MSDLNVYLAGLRGEISEAMSHKIEAASGRLKRTLIQVTGGREESPPAGAAWQVDVPDGEEYATKRYINIIFKELGGRAHSGVSLKGDAVIWEIPKRAKITLKPVGNANSVTWQNL